MKGLQFVDISARDERPRKRERVDVVKIEDESDADSSPVVVRVVTTAKGKGKAREDQTHIARGVKNSRKTEPDAQPSSLSPVEQDSPTPSIVDRLARTKKEPTRSVSPYASKSPESGQRYHDESPLQGGMRDEGQEMEEEDGEESDDPLEEATDASRRLYRLLHRLGSLAQKERAEMLSLLTPEALLPAALGLHLVKQGRVDGGDFHTVLSRAQELLLGPLEEEDEEDPVESPAAAAPATQAFSGPLLSQQSLAPPTHLASRPHKARPSSAVPVSRGIESRDHNQVVRSRIAERALTADLPMDRSYEPDLPVFRVQRKTSKAEIQELEELVDAERDKLTAIREREHGHEEVDDDASIPDSQYQGMDLLSAIHEADEKMLSDHQPSQVDDDDETQGDTTLSQMSPTVVAPRPVKLALSKIVEEEPTEAGPSLLAPTFAASKAGKRSRRDFEFESNRAAFAGAAPAPPRQASLFSFNFQKTTTTAALPSESHLAAGEEDQEVVDSEDEQPLMDHFAAKVHAMNSARHQQLMATKGG